MYDLETRHALASELAESFLTGRWNAADLAERGASCLDRWPDWMTALGMEVTAGFRSAPVRQRRRLVDLIECFLARRTDPAGEPPLIIRLTPVPAQPPGRGARVPARLAHDWPVAPIDSVVELAETLELSLGQLAWLADVRSLERRVTALRLQNYRYAAVARRSGLPRLIEAPKARLKEIQRWILHEILDHVPAHDSSHGFVRGRSAVSHARLHTGHDLVLRLDLRDFFASVAAGRVYGIFHTLGYRPAVAHTLTGLCTNTVPAFVWQHIHVPAAPALVGPHFWLGRQLATPHLPQGAPTSPALANLCAFGLDRRLTALAASAGWRYSRYADDLTFSGRHRRQRPVAQFQALVSAIVREEGFRLNGAKSSVRSTATRQSVCGIVVNARPNVARAEYDRLKAILHNAARDGPSSQTRAGVSDLQAHLRGRIAWVASLNPERGERLRRRFEQIAWETPHAEDENRLR